MSNTQTILTPASFALTDWRLPTSGVEAIRLCAENQINAIQIDFGGPGRSPCLDNSKRQELILEACDRYGVQITALAGNQLNDIGLGTEINRHDRKIVEDLIISILDVASRFSVPLVFLPSFRQGHITDQASLKRTANILRWACQEAQQRNIVLANENDLSGILARQLMAEVNMENFCLIFDCFNLVKAGHSAIEILTQMDGCFATQVHIKDGLIGKEGYMPLGQGDGQLKTILSALMKTTWAKLYVLESDYRDYKSLLLQNDLQWINQFFLEEL